MVGEIIFQVERGKLVATGRDDGTLSLNIHNNPPCGPSSSIWIALDEAELDWLRFQIVRLQRKTCRVGPKAKVDDLDSVIDAMAEERVAKARNQSFLSDLQLALAEQIHDMDAAVEAHDVAVLAGQVAA